MSATLCITVCYSRGATLINIKLTFQSNFCFRSAYVYGIVVMISQPAQRLRWKPHHWDRVL